MTEDHILETQNPNQSNSQSLDVIAILANMTDKAGENVSPTPTFKHPKIGEVDSTIINKGCSSFILKHIGIHY